MKQAPQSVDTLDYQIKFRSRRTIAVQLDAEGRVIVLAPRRTSDQFIRHFLGKSLPWIEKKKTQLVESNRRFPKRRLVTGEDFPLLGCDYPLVIIMDWTAKSSIAMVDGRIAVTVPGLDMATVRRALGEWLANEARQCITPELQRMTHLR